MRTKEAAEILRYLGLEVPEVPNTRMRIELRRQFETLSPDEVHVAMLHTLKRTRNLLPLADLVRKLPTSLHAAALSVPLRRGDHDRLLDAVNTPLPQAMAWA
jgi:hypothetical protein